MSTKREDYYRIALQSAIKIPAIYTIHYFRYGKNFRYPLEKHDFWELVFIDSGKATVFADNEKLSLEQGEIRFHAPDVEHTISTDDEFSNSVIISFEAHGRIMSFFENRTFTLNDKQKVLLSEIVNEAKEAFEGRLDDPNLTEMVKKQPSPFGSSQTLKNTLELLLISIVRSNMNVDINKNADHTSLSAHSDKIVEDILAILKSRVTSSVTLDEIADNVFFSKTYVKSVFKARTGTSIIKYYNALKIEEAKKLISLKKYNMTEITKMLGFSSVHYFSRLFKQLTDMSPSEYARSTKAENVLR